MKTVRYQTFETNSSSCHSITVMRKQDWNDFKNHDKIINSQIERTYSDDGYYDMKAQMLNPDVFIDIDTLKSMILEDDPDYGKSIENMTNEDIKKEMSTKGSELRDYIWNNELVIYDDDKECGWGMAQVTESNFGGDTEVVAVSREICC